MSSGGPCAPGDELSGDEIRLVGEIGFMAARARDVKSAMAIFEGLRTLRPRHAFVFIGLAMAHMAVGRAEEAVRILRDDGFGALPGDEELQAFLAIALQEAGRGSECRRLLQALATRSGPATGPRLLAASLLAAMTQELPAPAAARGLHPCTKGCSAG